MLLLADDVSLDHRAAPLAAGKCVGTFDRHIWRQTVESIPWIAAVAALTEQRSAAGVVTTHDSVLLVAVPVSGTRAAVPPAVAMCR